MGRMKESSGTAFIGTKIQADAQKASADQNQRGQRKEERGGDGQRIPKAVDAFKGILFPEIHGIEHELCDRERREYVEERILDDTAKVRFDQIRHSFAPSTW